MTKRTYKASNGCSVEIRRRFNRNIMGGRRRNRGISTMPIECIVDLSARIRYESMRLGEYYKRINNKIKN